MLYWTLADMVASRGVRNALEREFLRLPLYDITAVTEGIDDFRPLIAAAIPKRPPHDSFWIECEEDIFSGARWASPVVGRHVQGNWFVDLGDSYVEAMRPKLSSPVYGDSRDACEWARHAVGFTAYSMQLHTSDMESRRFNGIPFCVHPSTVFLFSDDWTKVVGVTTDTSGVMQRVDRDIGPVSLGLPVAGVGGSDEWVPWGAILVFGLLHCRNVQTSPQQPPQHRNPARAARRGLSERRPHKILRLVLPTNTHKRESSEPGEETSRHVALHCVRGHFMHLTDERYVNKGGQWVWRSPHIRGDADFGVIDKTYAPEVK